MALIDEYKQAIQDVLDGRAHDAPKPSELPWSEDKLATLWASAAAALIAEAAGGGSSSSEIELVNFILDNTGDTPSLTSDHTVEEVAAAQSAGKTTIGVLSDGSDMELAMMGNGRAGFRSAYTFVSLGATVTVTSVLISANESDEWAVTIDEAQLAVADDE